MQAEVRNDGRLPARPRLRVGNALISWILHTRVLRRLADGQLCELRFTGVRSGRPVRLPVMYAQRGEQLVVLVGGADRKRWWRNFIQPHPVQVLLRGVARTGVARVVAAGTAGRAEAAAVYAARFSNLAVPDDPMVVVTLDPVR